MSHSRLLSSCLLLILAAGCRAQVPSAPSSTTSSSISGPTPKSVADRRIEVLIRSQFSVPSDYDVIFGARTKSYFSGYETLPVTFSHHGKQTMINFLVSQDGNTLARLEKFDLTKDPVSAISVANRPVRGDAAAKVEIFNFDDLECPFCARMNSELATATLDHYKGLVKVVYKDYPLQEIHPWAMHAAVDANCLAELNAAAYWDDVDYVHSHGQDISGAQHEPAKSFAALDTIADSIGKRTNVDTVKLDACIKKQDESVIASSVKLGTALGIEGTPQVFVAGERLAGGARPLEELWAAIDRALKSEGIQPPPGAPPAESDDAPAKPGR